MFVASGPTLNAIFLHRFSHNRQPIHFSEIQNLFNNNATDCQQHTIKTKTCECYIEINVLFPFPGLEAGVEGRGHVLVTSEAHV